ncbi:hypothetical protein ACT453_47385, partial [Bacillus sp. D-CC]
MNETDAEYLVRKFDALEAKCAALENKVIPVSAELPPANESVLLFDANGERQPISQPSPLASNNRTLS